MSNPKKTLVSPEISFTFQPQIKSRFRWRIDKPIEHILHNGDKLTIPSGWHTDFASVPRWLWSFFPPYGDDLLAFIVHDYLYIERLYDRKFADEEMRHIQKSLGAPSRRYQPIYRAVRMFGGKYWRT